jgi:hypothetical protein
MRKYWLKIGFGALLIFVVGFAFISGARGVKEKITSGSDIEIPLGPFIGFNLDGTRLGTIRGITIRRSAPKVLAGFDLRVRLSDSTGIGSLEKCHLSVNDTRNIDERTHFICLASDSGFVQFGELRAELRTNAGSRVVVIPLLLPPEAVADLQRAGGDHSMHSDVGDSIRSEVATRVRVVERAYRDSIRAAEYDRSAARSKFKADSIRARSAAATPAGPVTPVPVKPPTP